MPTPDSRSQSDIHTPIEPDFDPQAELQRSAAQRAAASNDSLSDGKTTGGIVGDSMSSADLREAADHLDDVEFEFVDLTRLYDIGEPLGEGGMGTVYRAIEKQSRHPLAIKRLKSDLVTNRRARARFQSEGNAMLRLTHENIVRFFRMGCDSISPFYVMEFVEGGSLKDRLEKGKLELDEAIRMFVALAGGLSLSHRTGIIHRDIKPGNILLTLDGVPKLSDFGIARQVEGNGLTSTGAAMGTPFYMAPEQHKDGKTATELSDLYSLAATLYHAVTGELPISVRESRIPEPVRVLTLKALETDPGQRQPSVAEFAAELRAVQMQLSGPASATNDAAELKTGECPHCHTINPTSRKFCQKKGCAKPLVEPCPQCKTPTPAWELICAECGTDIPAHWEAAEKHFRSEAERIEALAAEQQYAEALELLMPFHLLREPHWLAWKKWAGETSAAYQTQLTRQQLHRNQLFNEAQELFKSAKYSLVVPLLDQIHPCQVTPEVQSLRALAESNIKELDKLIQAIKHQLRARDYVSVRQSVDRVLLISPNDHRVVNLDAKLRAREEAERQRREAPERDQMNVIGREARPQASKRQAEKHGTEAEDVARRGKMTALGCLARMLMLIVVTPLVFVFSVIIAFLIVELTAKKRSTDVEQSPTAMVAPDDGEDTENRNNHSLHQLTKENVTETSNPRPTGDLQSESNSQAGDTTEVTLPGGVKMKLVWCPPGTFTMGTPGTTDAEAPVQVTLTKGFWLSQTEVTQAQWTAVIGAASKPWSGMTVKEGPEFPASYISHGINGDGKIEADSATAFCEKLTEIERMAGRLPTGWKYALPTEAQWEYACRAGTKTAYSFGDDESQLGDYCWFKENTLDIGETYAHAVGTKKPNPWGLLDMHGNISEWCQDGFAAKLLGGSDPLNFSAVDRRVLRGGSWFAYVAKYTRSSVRYSSAPFNRSNDIGFRVSRTQ